MKHDSIPAWQLPPGVSPGTWDYARSAEIADQYDDYFAEHPLMRWDQDLVLRYLPPLDDAAKQTVADLGCGTGRVLAALAKRGYRGLAIDLSQAMLRHVESKRRQAQLPIHSLRANWVQLDGLQDRCVDHAVSLFSTLGMIRGRRNRIVALEHTRRILRPGGMFIVHVHNLWSSLRDPAGVPWLIKSLASSMRAEHQWGDRVYQYRGLPNMFLHNYRLSELKSDLKSAGFRIKAVEMLNVTADDSLASPKLLGRLRAGGFIAVCQTTTTGSTASAETA